MAALIKCTLKYERTKLHLYITSQGRFNVYIYMHLGSSQGQFYLLDHLSATIIKRFTSRFPSDFKSMFVWHLTGKILRFEFQPKAVFFEWKFRILWSAIIHIQNWPIGLQKIGSRIRWRQRLASLKLQHVNAAYCTCKTRV